MCFLLTIAFVIAAVTFFSKGLLIQTIMSGVIAAIFLFLFIRKLITNGRCIFGKDRDCNKL
ncbi:MAG: hypothetical protein IE884_00750 [Sulfuricurvum sp.]|nr:hypothetical protein [Sulfuricurvum sp.]